MAYVLTSVLGERAKWVLDGLCDQLSVPERRELDCVTAKSAQLKSCHPACVCVSVCVFSMSLSCCGDYNLLAPLLVSDSPPIWEKSVPHKNKHLWLGLELEMVKVKVYVTPTHTSSISCDNMDLG